MQNTRSPLSASIGQLAQIRVVSQSHGIIRPNMVTGVDWTPKISGKEIAEFDNVENALIYTTFDGATGKMAYEQSNQGLMEALLMDTDPSAAQVWTCPTQFKPFTYFENWKGPDGKIKGSALLKECHVTGDPFTSTVKEAAKGTLDFMFKNAHRFLGLAIQYVRARANTGPAGQPTILGLSTTTTGGFLAPETYYFRITAVTAVGESQGSIEQAIVVPVGTSTNLITVTTPSPAGSITSYNVYGWDRSNGERYIGKDAGLGSLVVTALPISSAVPCPNLDSTGCFQAPEDLIFAGNTITLPQPAFAVPATGLQYALICKNGYPVADPINPAGVDDFYFNAAGTTFSVGTTPAATDWWDIFTLYEP